VSQPAPADGQRRERRNIADLSIGERLDDEVYLLIQKELRTSHTGSLYIHAVVADQTGQMAARMWDASREIYDAIPASGLLHVRGRIESYKGKPQLIIDGLRAVDPGTVDPTAFLPRTRHDVDQMWARLRDILRGIRQPALLALVARFVNNEEFAQRFRTAPAARALHHAYIGGLLEHTLSLLELAERVLPRYPQVSADLVLAGIFLHDAGKTTELVYENRFEYSDEGQLVGHIVQVVVWLDREARAIEQETGRAFPELLLAALKHVILAHHGQYEFGSPKLPASPEALMVHYLDNLDAKLNMMFAAIETDADESSNWTSWVPALQTKVFKPDLARPAQKAPPQAGAD
jgi:3'-5' exoribonuclease